MAGSWLTGLYTAGATTNAVVQLSSFALLMGIEVIMVAAVVVVVLPQKRTATNSPERKAPDEEREASKADATARVPFQQRAAEFAQRYQLTAREEEVAKQMLMGHSYSRIMQELCIAEGTVNYHARNIYAKAGVHSKQELVELFESEQ